MKKSLGFLLCLLILVTAGWGAEVESIANTGSAISESEVLAATAIVPVQDESEKDKPMADAMPIVQMEKMMINASPIMDHTKVTTFGDAVTIVTADQIDQLNAQDLATALVKVPGVTMSRHNIIGAYGGGDGGATFIRGHGASRPGQETATLIDGVPKFSGIWTHSLVDMLPIDSASNIEVYKSSQPVRFGNMSNGVINMVSKKRVEEGFGARVLSEFGSYETWIQRLEAGFNYDGVDGYFEGHMKDSEGHRENAGGQVAGLYTRLGYQVTQHWAASFQVHHTTSSVEDPREKDLAPLPLTETFNTNSNMEIITIENDYECVKGSLKLYRDQGLQDWVQWSQSESLPFSSKTKFVNYGIRFQETVKVIEKSEILVGLDYDFYGGYYAEEHETYNLFERDMVFRNTAPYVMAAYTIGEKINVTPSFGVRYNMSEYFDNQIGYQAGLKGSVDDLGIMLYANYAKGFNLPGIYSSILFNGYNWQELEAEEVKHMEVGMTHQIIKEIRYHIAYFQDDVTNALNVVLPPPPPARYDNIGTYTSKGINAEFQIMPIKNMDLFVGGTWMQSDPDLIPYLPKWTVTAGINYTLFEIVTIGLNMQAVDNYYVGNPRSPQEPVLIEKYTLVNVRVSSPLEKIIASPVKGELFVAIENALNSAYELKPNYPMPGITVMAGMDIRL